MKPLLTKFRFASFLAAISRLLLKLPPEVAHSIAVMGMRLLQIWRFRIQRGQSTGLGAAVILKPIPQLKFPSRLGLAAGFDKNAEVFASLASLGFGFLEVGTVTPRPQDGNPKPRIWRVGNGALVNHLGFNSKGVDRFRKNILNYRGKVLGTPLLANIGKNRSTSNEGAIHDYRICLRTLADCVDGFVINLSSPNTPGLFQLQSAEFLESLAAELPMGLPAWVKLSPDLSDREIRDLCAQVRENSRFAGVVLTNTSRKLAQSLVGAPVGGLSGTPLFHRSLECVAIARQSLSQSKTVIGVGGVSNGVEAKKMREAGADLVEIYTSFIYGGPKVVQEIKEALDL